MIRAAAFLLLACLAGSALSAQVLKPCKSDTRVRCVAYDPFEVVTIKAMFGYQTFILFSSDEKVEDLGGGDTAAWDIGITRAKNGIFIKPKDHRPATNITVITNKRHYNFDFEVEDFKEAERRTYMVWFTYPEDEARAKAAASIPPQETIPEILKFAAAAKPKNEDYWAEGASEMMPTAAWDDGAFTYLRFAPNVPFPAVYAVNDDGTETLLNKHVPEANTIALQMISKKFVLRRGDAFTCIFNESYDAYGIENQSRTVSSQVVRTIRKQGDSGKNEDQTRPAAVMPQPMVPAAAGESNQAAQRATREPLPTVDLSREAQRRGVPAPVAPGVRQ